MIPRSALVFCGTLSAVTLFLLLGPYSNFAPPGYLDTWFYTGYFTHFSYLIQHYGINYYVSRLPWIIPGVAVFKVATPAAASVILNALILACSTTALWFIVTWHYGRVPAVLACIALMTNPYVMSSVSWDYPDGPATAYAFLALACFLRPVERRVPNAVLGGACLALSGYTNLAALPVLLGIVVIPAWRHKRSFRELLRQAIYIVCGIGGTTLVFAIVGKLLIHKYLFYMPQIQQIMYTFDHPGYLTNMWGTGYAWIPLAYRLLPALFMIVVGGVLLGLRRKCSGACIESYLCFVVSCALFSVFEFGFHNTGLRVSYCSSYLMAPLLVFSGTLMGECLSAPGEGQPVKVAEGNGERTEKRAFTITAAIWTLVAMFGLALPFYYSVGFPVPSSSRQMWAGMLIVAVSTAVCIMASPRQQIFSRPLLCCLIFLGLFIGPACDGGLGYIWAKGNASAFQLLMRIESLVDSGMSPDRSVRFWYDLNEPERNVPGVGRVRASHLFESAYSLYLWGNFDFTKQLASAPKSEIKGLLNANTTLVHLSVDTDDIPERTRLLSARGIIVGNERRWIVPSVYGNLCIVLQDVLDDSGLR